VAGDEDLSGLGLYYLLERATSLRELHLLLRDGPRNRTRSGLQQSYGDHNRLLLHGLDRLLAGDLDWYRERSEADVADDDLKAAVAQAAALGLPPDALVALWLGAALHDCGLLAGGAPSIDVEDAAATGTPLLDEWCPPEYRDLAVFAVRNHDYVKDLFLGEVPASMLAADMAALPEDQRATAVAALGLIQVAGAASLGEGRLTAFRLAIFSRCLDGTVLQGHSAATRLARLVAPGLETVDPPDVATSPPEPELAAFLDAAPCHRWHRVWAGSDGAGAPPAAKVAVLHRLAALWRENAVDHVVLAPGIKGADAASEGWRPTVRVARYASGVTAAVVS
jgi:hypothetical protein